LKLDADESIFTLQHCAVDHSNGRSGAFKYYGITTSLFRGGPKSSIKYGLTAVSQDFSGQFRIQFINSSNQLQTFDDNVTKHGSNLGMYVQEQFQASPVIDLNAGIRYDRSTGFVDGNQVSPRVEFNYHPDANNTIHLYYGRLYAAPALEDVRRDASIVNGSGSGGLRVYDLKPETDSIYEGGIAHDFTPSIRATPRSGTATWRTSWTRPNWVLRRSSRSSTRTA
jgi:outer membrane receptor protein involved in Fe transport